VGYDHCPHPVTWTKSVVPLFLVTRGTTAPIPAKAFHEDACQA